MRVCSFGPCDRATTTATHCKAHNQQLRRRGRLSPLRKSGPPREKQPRKYLPCTFEGCNRDRGAKLWCEAHYNQLWRGEPMRALGERRKPDWTLRGILGSTDKSGDCLIFRSKNRGYPQINVAGVKWIVHRAVFHLTHGYDIAGIPIHHKCGNAKCVNPEHLEPASASENTLEMLGRKAYEARIRNLEARVLELEAELAEAKLVLIR